MNPFVEEETPAVSCFGEVLARYTPKVQRPLIRKDYIEYFLTNANQYRIPGKKEWSAGFIASRLSHLTLFDLAAFKSQCEDRKRVGYPWGKYFWGSLKPKK